MKKLAKHDRKPKPIARLVKSTISILGAFDSAFDLLERQANKYAILDQAVSKLLGFMNGQVRIEGLEQIYGEKIVSYRDENHVEIVIVDKEEGPFGFRTFNKTRGHNRFEAARKHVEHWLKEHSGYSVHLKYMAVDKYNSQNCLFEREQTVPIPII